MANQDQQNCTDNGTIEKEDEMHIEMANQDQQNCTDNGTIEKEDEMHIETANQDQQNCIDNGTIEKEDEMHIETANQDQQNCTDNATIEKEDEMHKLPLSDISSTNSNISLQLISNEIAPEEILDPMLALHEVVEPIENISLQPFLNEIAHNESLEPVVELDETFSNENISLQLISNEVAPEEIFHEVLEPIENISLQPFLNEIAFNESLVPVMELDETLEPVVELDETFSNENLSCVSTFISLVLTLICSPTFYSTTPRELNTDGCKPPSFYRTIRAKVQDVSLQPFNEISKPPEVTNCPPSSIYRTTHDEKQGSCTQPSFYRTIPVEKQGISGDEQWVMPRENYFIVRPMVLTDNNVPHEDDWEIPEELAVCNFCFNKLIVQEIMMKTKCRCKDALVHEACALNKKCHSCGINFDKIKVTLLIKPNVEVSKEKREKKWKMFSLFKF